MQVINSCVWRTCDKWIPGQTPLLEYSSTRAQLCLCFLRRQEPEGWQSYLSVGWATAVPFKVTASDGTFRWAGDQVFSLVAPEETSVPDIPLSLLDVTKLLLFLTWVTAAHFHLNNTWKEEMQLPTGQGHTLPSICAFLEIKLEGDLLKAKPTTTYILQVILPDLCSLGWFLLLPKRRGQLGKSSKNSCVLSPDLGKRRICQRPSGSLTPCALSKTECSERHQGSQSERFTCTQQPLQWQMAEYKLQSILQGKDGSSGLRS